MPFNPLFKNYALLYKKAANEEYSLRDYLSYKYIQSGRYQTCYYQVVEYKNNYYQKVVTYGMPDYTIAFFSEHYISVYYEINSGTHCPCDYRCYQNRRIILETKS
jgi:hypothetical protein